MGDGLVEFKFMVTIRVHDNPYARENAHSIIEMARRHGYADKIEEIKSNGEDGQEAGGVQRQVV